MSEMLLEKNDRASSLSRTKHIEIRYLFIQDRVEKVDIGLEYCHTDKMVADFMTKPLQGKSSSNSGTASWECQMGIILARCEK